MTGSARSLIPNGPLIKAYRKQLGWSREEFEWRSHLAVEREALDDDGDVRFTYRYKEKSSEGKFAGICTTTLTNIESSKPVYPFTLRIVAKTFRVQVKSLIHPDDPSCVAVPPDTDAGTAPDSLRQSILDTAADPARLSEQEKAEALRQLLDALFPPVESPREVS